MKHMHLVIVVMSLLGAPSAWGTDCVTNARGKVICSNGQKAVAVNPNTGTATTVEKSSNAATAAQGTSGTKAAYNPRTGNAAVSQQNSNGVTTTQTARGGEAKGKNGKGVVQGPNGTTCAKSKNNQGCSKS